MSSSPDSLTEDLHQGADETSRQGKTGARLRMDDIRYTIHFGKLAKKLRGTID